ncbi:hypothetical protein Ancab_005322 [Ancistrocladus abbreviatus]
MASFAQLMSLFFLLTLLFSLQIHARDSQFFSMVTRENTNTNTNTKANTNVQEQASATKEQEPTFIPQTTQTGYGLYGHETGQLPPSTTSPTTKTTDDPTYSTTYKTQFEEPINSAHGTNNFNNFNNNNYMYNMDAFGTKEKGNTKDSENGYYFNTNSNNGKNYIFPENYNSDNQNVGKQGMSDTRFLENGRYFYDPNAGKNVPYFEDQNSGRNEYFNNNINGYYGNIENFNSNDQYKKGMQEFENQEEDVSVFEP